MPELPNVNCETGAGKLGSCWSGCVDLQLTSGPSAFFFAPSIDYRQPLLWNLGCHVRGVDGASLLKDIRDFPFCVTSFASCVAASLPLPTAPLKDLGDRRTARWQDGWKEEEEE